MTTDTTQTELFDVIERFINEVREAKGMAPSFTLRPDTSLVDGSAGIDSLDLAALVVELQNHTGKDPFADGFVNFEDATTLVALYSR
jgi:acyl carrier protein